MKRLLSLASCSLVGRLDGSVCAKACVATPRTTAIHVTCVFVSMKVRIFMLFSRPALRMVLNRALAVDWTVVHHAATSLAGTHVETRAIARILCRGPGQARLLFVSLPLRMRGDGAPGGAAVVGSRSASPCGNAEAPPGAPPEHLSMPGLICGRLLPLRPQS